MSGLARVLYLHERKRLRALAGRQREGDGGSMSGFARRPDAPAVRFDELLGGSEAEAGADNLPKFDERRAELAERHPQVLGLRVRCFADRMAEPTALKRKKFA